MAIYSHVTPHRQIDTIENITFPQLLWWAVSMWILIAHSWKQTGISKMLKKFNLSICYVFDWDFIVVYIYWWLFRARKWKTSTSPTSRPRNLGSSIPNTASRVITETVLHGRRLDSRTVILNLLLRCEFSACHLKSVNGVNDIHYQVKIEILIFNVWLIC